MIDFNKPVQVAIHIHSEVADFQTTGKAGWLESVLVRHLPQFPSSLETVIAEVRTILEDVGFVPYSNQAVMQEFTDVVAAHHADALAGMDAVLLDEDNNCEYFYAITTDGAMTYNLGVIITQREDSAVTQKIIADRTVEFEAMLAATEAAE